MTQAMYAPSANQQYQAKSGNTYTADANKIIAGVVVGDVNSLINLGCIQIDPSGYYVRKIGTVTANGATAVTVADAAMAITDFVDFSLNTIGGTPAGAPYLSALTAGTSFACKAVAGDTSVYNYMIYALNN